MGVIVYTLLVGSHPFRGDNETELFANIADGQWSFPAASSLSGNARDFVSRLLTVNPQDRMSARECLEHQWLQTDELPNLCSKPVLRRTRSAMQEVLDVDKINLSF